MKIACVGEAMLELSFHQDAPQLGFAGDTLNTAVYLKRAAPALKVDYITKLGADSFSDRMKQFISSMNIGVSAIKVVMPLR